MSSYIQTPSGGQVTNFSHVGGALATPAGVPGSQYPSNSAPFGAKVGFTSGEVGSKLYPYTETRIIGMPLFARAGGHQQIYTPPS
jgi:hypothetical protein